MASTLRFLTVSALIILATSFFAPSSWAARVVKVKGKKVFIQLEGEPAKKGQIFYLINSKGRKKGLIKLKGIKGDRAIAVLLGKSRARKGDSLLARSKKGKRRRPRVSKKFKDTRQMMWGLLFGMSKNSMTVSLYNNPEEKSTMTGYGLNYKAILDYALFKKIWLRGMLGMENFDAQGNEVSSSCQNKVCSVNIQYLSIDIWGCYFFSSGHFRPWLGVGFNFSVPRSQETTILQEDSINNLNVIELGGGFNWLISSRFYIPFQLEYNFIPANEQVSPSRINAHLGLGMNF